MISNFTNDSTIDRNKDDIEDITTSLYDFSIQSPGKLDTTSLTHSSDKADNPTVQHSILLTVKSKIIYHNPVLTSWNEAIVLKKAGKNSDQNKRWFNLKDFTDKHLSGVDFSLINVSKNSEE